MQHYVVGFVLSRQHVLLLEKLKPSHHKNILNGIGGKIEPPETPLACIKRECQEETGLHIATWHLIERGLADDGGDLYTYIAVFPTGQTVTKGDAGQALWYRISELPPQVLPDVPRLVHIAVQQSMYMRN